jgi:glycosyltransferase involved in cell wall biosynthesis
VLYATDTYGIHDDRFVSALGAASHVVDVATRFSSENWLVAGQVSTGDALARAGYDLVQLGPLALAPHAGPFLDRVPVMAICWGSEAFVLADDATRTLLASAAAVLCDCAAVGERLVDLGADRTRMTVFPWGIDLERFHPPAATSIGGWRTLVSTRSWEPFYAHDLTIRALRAARAAGADDLRLRLYGGGSEEGALRSLIEELDLAEMVDLLPPVEEGSLAEILGRATAWVNAAPSDGICISLLQAMACGADVLTTDVPCAREAVGPFPAAFFEPGDIDALASLMVAAERPVPRREARHWLETYADWSRNSRIFVRAVEEAGA